VSCVDVELTLVEVSWGVSVRLMLQFLPRESTQLVSSSGTKVEEAQRYELCCEKRFPPLPRPYLLEAAGKGLGVKRLQYRINDLPKPTQQRKEKTESELAC
jgi:hypothetical protein